jgi:uncharacterized protein (DUF58 family)
VSLFLTNRFFVVLAGLVVGFVAAYFEPALTPWMQGIGLAAAGVLGVDAALLTLAPGTVTAERSTPERFSNGDDNPVRVHLASTARVPLRLTVIDELPVQLQRRDFEVRVTVPPGTSRTVRYSVRPTERGAYAFGAVNVYAATALGLVERRIRTGRGEEVPVYPSFLQMQKYGLMAASDRLEEVGVKKVRRLGHTMEFDHIREYVRGDDYRSINWKASARRGDLMVNEYRDERAQPVYCILNMGRVMKLPFDGMTLLDHSINASLALSNIVLQKQDRAGLIAFSNEVGPVVPAEREGGQMGRIQESLYRLDTDFLEADYRRLAAYVRSHVHQRSLLLLFTNFTARSSMERHLASLQGLARHHPTVVVFFENTELSARVAEPPETTQDIYVQTVAEKFAFEQREIVRTLRRHGLYSLYVRPGELTAQTINRYLELKARGVA